MSKGQLRYPLIFACLWLMFTLTLVSWWVSMLLSFFSDVETDAQLALAKIPKLKNMIIWEGMTLFFLIVIGAVPLIYLIYKESKRTEKFKQFFSYFSHDIKTSMASLRLQVECLKDDLNQPGEKTENLFDRMLSDTSRLQLQLDNSLLMSQLGSPKVFMQPIGLEHIFSRLQLQWPNMKLNIKGTATILADQRLIESVLNNLCQNSLIHGQATEAQIEIFESSLNKIQINYHDNGKGFAGKITDINKPAKRLSSTSGSGLGLFLIHKMTSAMSGEFNIITVKKGFFVQLIFQQAAPHD